MNKLYALYLIYLYREHLSLIWGVSLESLRMIQGRIKKKNNDRVIIVYENLENPSDWIFIE